MTLLDENAFGLLVAFFDIEDAEYGADRESFIVRFTEFRSVALEHAASTPIGEGAIALDLGHAIYFEIGDGDQACDPVSWLNGLRTALTAREFRIVAVVSHGSRWTRDTSDGPDAEDMAGGYRLLRATRPSEPLRRALHAETATHGTEGGDGWGPGLYVDAEAVEALGKTFKNSPTPLAVAGATFYRAR